MLPLYQGLVHVSSDSRGESPRFDLTPLATRDLPLTTLRRWFRHFVEVRDDDGANRCLLTAIESGASGEQLVDMLMTAATDHFFLDGGHVADFINKASELLDITGWDNAGQVLPSLTFQLCNARRSEELNAWRHPIDLTAILPKALQEIPPITTVDESGTFDGLAGLADLADVVLGDDPQATVDALLAALDDGLSLLQVSQTVTYAAALRVARFHTQNEFSDWIGVLHTFSYCNAVQQAIRRTRSIDVLRGVFHGAMRVYLDRSLNVPAARLPAGTSDPSRTAGPDSLLKEYLGILDTQQQVEPAAKIITEYLRSGYEPERLFRTLVESLLREDAEFHTFQMLEAGIRQYLNLREQPEADHVLIGVVRYLAAHAPTARAMNQTAQIAVRLNRGEALFEEE